MVLFVLCRRWFSLAPASLAGGGPRRPGGGRFSGPSASARRGAPRRRTAPVDMKRRRNPAVMPALRRLCLSVRCYAIRQYIRGGSIGSELARVRQHEERFDAMSRLKVKGSVSGGENALRALPVMESSIHPTIARAEDLLRDIIAKVDDEDATACETARREKKEHEERIAALEDQRAIAEAKILQHQDKPASIHRDFEAHPTDLLHAFGLFMKTFFDATMKGVAGFFGSTAPPAFQSIKIGPGEADTVEAPSSGARWIIPLAKKWMIPGYVESEMIQTDVYDPEGSGDATHMRVTIKTTKRRRIFWDKLLQLFDAFRFEESIFKGKVIDDDFQYLPFGGVDWNDVILDAGTAETARIALRSPIIHKDARAAAGLPFRRGVLLSGKYGTGKTLLAKALAKDASANGVTFIVAKDADNFAQTLHRASIYAPAVVFMEDVDAVAGADRDDDVNEVLNTLDGLHTLGDVMVVLTTNHVEKMSAALTLRPGRIDDIITIGPADDAGRVTLIKRTVDSMGALYDGAPDDDAKIARATDGFPGAFMVEVVRGAVARAVANGMSAPIRLTADDLVYGASRLEPRAAEYRKHDPSAATPSLEASVAKIASTLPLLSLPASGPAVEDPFSLYGDSTLGELVGAGLPHDGEEEAR